MATIETDRRAKLVSWAVAALVTIGATVLFTLLPTPDAVEIRPPAPREKAERRPERERKTSKPLPEELVEARMESSKLVVRKELRKRLELFRKLEENLASELEDNLGKVEDRPLHQGLPEEHNDVSVARSILAPPLPELGGSPSIEELYNQLAIHEDRILNGHLANLAATKSLREGSSFPEVLDSMRQNSSRMPSYGSMVDAVKDQHGISGDLLPPAGYLSTDDINRYRDLLSQTTRQSGLAESRLLGLVSEIGRTPPPAAPARGGGKGASSVAGDGGMKVEGAAMKRALYNLHQPKFESEELVAAQALPGRRFSRSSNRRGWLYVNSWYMIGPWDSFGRNDFTITHAPEQGIDLDAVYHDGQTGTGIAETDSHPLRVSGEEVELDGTLRWKFMQSESMHNAMPVTTDRSTCYAYTELFFEVAETMLVAIGTDDSGKLWINGQEVWNDEGASWYHIDEHLEPIAFRQGWNRILVRIDNNGGAASGFSFLICPKDAPIRDGARAR